MSQVGNLCEHYEQQCEQVSENESIQNDPISSKSSCNKVVCNDGNEK